MVSRKFSWFLLFAFVSFIFSVSLAVQAQVNILQNPDFEDATDAPWTMWVEGASAGAVATKGIDTSESVTGSQSLLITISSPGGDKRVELHQNPFTLNNGQKLTYALWAKTEDSKTRDAKMICNERADPWTSYGSQSITITDQWTEFWVPVEMTANSVNVGIYVELKDTPAPAKVWFDHFRLYVGDYVEENLVEPSAVRSPGKLTVSWGQVKSN